MDVNILDHQKFVYKKAHYYKKFGAEFDDLVSEGNVGLLEAKERFDSTRGYKFLTFAGHYICMKMRRLLDKNNKLPTSSCDNDNIFLFVADHRNPFSELKTKDNVDRLSEKMKELSTLERNMIHDRFYERMTLKQMESKYNISFVSCKIRVEKILKKIKIGF